jgi:hypothetical protein
MARCIALRKSGGRCSAKAVNDSTYCLFHSPEPEHKLASTLGRRKGGLRAHQDSRLLPPGTPDVKIASARDVSALLSQVINRVQRGELEVRVANSVAYIAGVLLTSLEHASSVTSVEFNIVVPSGEIPIDPNLNSNKI